jgi:hypothetical protein
MQSVQACKVQVAAIEDIEAAGLEGQLIEDVHIVNTARGDNHHRGIIAPQRQEGVQLDRGLGAPELRPGKERQAQIDGRRVQRIGGLLEFGAKGFVGVEHRGLGDELLSEIGEDAPVSFFAGVGQSAPGGSLTNAAVVKLGTDSAQAGLDVAQAFPIGQLGKSHDEELLVRRQRTHTEIAPVAPHTLIELVLGQTFHQLGENCAAMIHGPPSRKANRLQSRESQSES